MRIELSTGTAAEYAEPAGAARAGLVVIPDIAGLRPLFDDLVARLAADHGWAVCAPELFAGKEHLDRDERFVAAADLDDEEVLGDALAAADRTGCDRVGIIGFCMGGMYVLKSSQTGRFARSAAFYGMIRVPDDWVGPGQGQPLDALSAGDPASMIAIVGTDDPYTPPDDVETLEAAGVTVVRYEGCEHGFVHDPARPAHNADAAADAWQRAIAWLEG